MTKTVQEAVVEAVTNRAKGGLSDPSLSVWADRPAPIVPAPKPATWPMPVTEFRDGQYLEPGDIVLSTRLESFFAFLVKRFDDSRFAHAALTFVTPRHYPGVDQSYLIESTFSGVDLGSLSEILAPTAVFKDTREKPRYLVGIKRLETDWFTPQMRPMVSGRMLRFIKDDEYNFPLLVALATNRSKFFFRLRDSLFGGAPTIGDFLKRSKKFAPVEFICSGFVQFAYVDMVRSAIELGLLSEDRAEAARDDVFFAPWVSPRSSMEELMAVKPLELASSERLKWKYLIYDGLVYQVSTEQEVGEIYDRINDNRRANHAA
ncbi:MULTISPECIES: hypothetical protein [Rhodomicrobium]|uniref:hypothetical protein n=1 Tax=Rhodomicrobium TaxID=1068 RepID=UPI000F73B9C6|nr:MULTISPECIES: hypothetical protein [Rhodomicrobium]